MHNRRPAPARRPSPRDRFARGPRIRVGMLMDRHMDFAGFGDVEALMSDEGLTPAPMTIDGKPIERVVGPAHASVMVLPTAGARDLEGGGMAGLVAPDSPGQGEGVDAGAFDKLVATAAAEAIPVLAFGRGVARALRAVGYAPPSELPPAVMLHEGVRILETEDEVRDALRTFAPAAAARRLAA